MEQVEDEVSERFFDAFLKCGLQVGEACVAVFGEDDDFAVEDRGLAWERGDLRGDGLHAMRPVEAGASEELDGGAFFAGLDTVAVEFELVEPAGEDGGVSACRASCGGMKVGKIFFWEFVRVERRIWFWVAV